MWSITVIFLLFFISVYILNCVRNRDLCFSIPALRILYYKLSTYTYIYIYNHRCAFNLHPNVNTKYTLLLRTAIWFGCDEAHIDRLSFFDSPAKNDFEGFSACVEFSVQYMCCAIIYFWLIGKYSSSNPNSICWMKPQKIYTHVLFC